MKLETKIKKGMYQPDLQEVPRHYSWGRALNTAELVNVLTVNELREYVRDFNKKRDNIIKANTDEREGRLQLFREDMVKEVKRTLSVEQEQAEALSKRVYQNNQGKSVEDIYDELVKEMDYVQRFLN